MDHRNLQAAQHAEMALNQMTGVVEVAERLGYEFTMEECRRVLTRLVDGVTDTLEEAIQMVAFSTNCPIRHNMLGRE